MSDPRPRPPAPDLFGQSPDLTEVPPDLWPERIAALVDLVLDEIQQVDARLPPALARHLASRTVVRLIREHGGTMWYIPQPGSLERVLRNLTIWAEHDGTTDGPHGVRALARRYRLSDASVWAILKVEREHHRRRVQPELPGLCPDPGPGSAETAC